MTPAETLSYLPQSTLERWRLGLAIAYQAEQNEVVKEMIEAINESLELKQLNHFRGFETTEADFTFV